MALIGGVLSLNIMQMPFSISAGVGFIALSGISILNGIVLVTYFNRLFKEGKSPDWDLKGFLNMYQEIQKVNHAFNQRLHEIIQSDANSNALVILDCFASMIMMDAEIEQIIPDEFQHAAMFWPARGTFCLLSDDRLVAAAPS